MDQLTDAEIERVPLFGEVYAELCKQFPDSKFDDRIAESKRVVRESVSRLNYIILEAEGKLNPK